MKKIKFIVSLFFFLVNSAMGNQSSFDEVPKKMMNREITLKKGSMEMFFKDSLYNWNRDGIYLFVSQKESLKLFFINESGVELFQYPKMKESRWTNPEEYMDERKKKIRGLNIGKCLQRINDDGNAFSFLKKITFERYPQISVMKDWPELPQIENIQYLGFVKEGSFIKNFYFNDFRSNGVVLKKPLDMLIPLYDMLKKYPFDVYMDGCE
ncbi:hypothetical protein [Fibrobacter sp. UWB13]|uniref:hypothetical protein n=1 Tax=Fibrobacter sp. UWB13 TaxID=1896204 RepID=UPI000A0ECF18|nr:hypothetical protein [Fibrobacter sp. UWB13]SMG18496.1 hypothetical protein SAMN05720489_1055 [Fibrobacter sp. UWB13]